MPASLLGGLRLYDLSPRVHRARLSTAFCSSVSPALKGEALHDAGRMHSGIEG